MENKKIAIILGSLLLINLISSSPVLAESIIFKSGKRIEGKIIERTNKYIKVDISGLPVTYFLDEIKSIDTEKIISGGNENAKINHLNEKDRDQCEVYSKESGLEEAEKIVVCPDSIRYIHALYKFAVILPSHWSKIHINERDPAELGKISSIAFSPADGALTLLHIIMKINQNRAIEDVLAEHIQKNKNEKGFKIESEPEKIEIKNLKAIKYAYSNNMIPKVICYLVFNDSFVYELSFCCTDIYNCPYYINDFEKIIKTIIVLEKSGSELLQSGKVEFIF